ncbi:MAG: oligosaccharide flippase family protein [Pseudomonadota bacterium]
MNSQATIIEKKNLSKLIKGATINIGGDFLSKFLLFGITLLLARILSTAELGIYFIAFSISQIASIISTLGLRTAAVRYISVYNAQNDDSRLAGTLIASLWISGLFSIIVGAVLILASKSITVTFFDRPELSNILFFFAFAVPFESVMRISLAALQGLKYMKYAVIVEKMAILIIRLMLMILLVSTMGWGLKGAAISYLGSMVCGMVMALYFCNNKIPLIKAGRRPRYDINNLLRYSLPMLPTTLMRNVAKEVEILLLGWLGSASLVGIYTVAIRLIGACEITFLAFRQIFDPMIAELHFRNEIEQLSRLLKVTTKWAFTISLPFFLGIMFFPSFFLSLFSEEISKGAMALSLLLIGHLVSSLSQTSTSVIVMSGKSYLELINNIFFLIALFVLNYLLIPHYALMGTATAHMISISSLACIRFAEVHNMLKIHSLEKSFFKPIVAAIAILLIGWFTVGFDAQLPFVRMTIILIASFASYAGLLILFRLEDQDLLMIDMIKSRLIKLYSK